RATEATIQHRKDTSPSHMEVTASCGSKDRALFARFFSFPYWSCVFIRQDKWTALGYDKN
ncbi:hypothetical protein, partial [Sporolactobacillus inulinus]|uniref:hypothetical protein n=1 Tax=Sporolactobacillus inulinus TaxID=2078 RepID=UPI001C3F509C